MKTSILILRNKKTCTAQVLNIIRGGAKVGVGTSGVHGGGGNRCRHLQFYLRDKTWGKHAGNINLTDVSPVFYRQYSEIRTT